VIRRARRTIRASSGEFDDCLSARIVCMDAKSDFISNARVYQITASARVSGTTSMTATYTNYFVTLAIEEIVVARRTIDCAMLGGMR
jgi:hypothetical protein